MSGRAVAWTGVALICLCAAFAALIEALLVPLYAGRVVVPVAVVMALIGNVAFPRMVRSLVPTTGAILLPLAAWLAVMMLFLWGRPEGDVAFPSKPVGAAWVFYGVLFGGAAAGIAAVVVSMPPPTRKQPGRLNRAMSRR